MWLFVVAAGSGYLARCLQSASGAKKQRLIQVIEKQDGNDVSRSPPQEADDNYPVSKEAMQFKERFDRLAEQHQAALDKKDGQGWSFSCSDPSCFPMLSYQKGYCDAQPASSRRFKGKGWPAWPKHVKGSQLSRKRTPRAGSPANASTCDQKSPKNDVPEVRDAESEDSTTAGLPVGDQQPSQCPGIGFSEDVFWQRKMLAGTDSPEADLLGTFDWASLTTSKQLHGLKGLSGSTCSRRHRIRSTTSSTPGTPSDVCGPALPPVEVFLRKRKAYDSSPTKPRSPRHDPAILRKEVVFFALGLRAGVFVMLFYMIKMTNRKQAAERLTDIDSIPEGGSGARSAQAGEVDDDNESVTSVVTVEHQEPDQMAVLEAELEAELEIMEFNLQAKKLPGVKPRSESPRSPISFDKEERNAKENWAVSPRELDRRLHVVLEERQATQIKHLEAELEEKEKQLLVKEEEVRSWKLRVDRLKAIYLASADAGLGGQVATCDGPALERPGNRKRWFSNVRQSTSVHASLPLLPPSIEEIDDESCSGTESPKHSVRGFDLLDESTEDHSDDASRTVRDFFRNMEQASSPDGKPSTSSSMVRVLPAQMMEASFEPPIHRDDGYEKTTTEVRDLKKVYVNSSTEDRTSGLRHTNCRIKEASSRFRDGERRHSTGSTAASRSRSQRQRKRWFS